MRLALGVTIGAVWMIANRTAPLEALERALYDLRVMSLRPGPPDGRLQLIQLPGNFSADDATRLARHLSQARVMAFDTPLDGPIPPELNRQLALNGVWASHFRGGIYGPPGNVTLHLPAPAGLRCPVGFAGYYVDDDGITRRVHLRQAVAAASGQPAAYQDAFLLQILKRWDSRMASQLPGSYLTSSWGIALAGPAGTYPALSWEQALKQPADTFRDKLVILGSAAKIRPMAGVGPMSDLEIHANALATLFNQSAFRPISAATADAVIVLMGMLGGLLAGLLAPLTAALAAPLAAVVLTGINVWAFQAHWWVDLAAPLGALLNSAWLLALVRFLTEGRKRGQVKRAFRHHLSPEAVEAMLKDPESIPTLKSERRVVTVLFSDIAGFTELSARLPTEEVVRLLNEHLTAMTRVLFANQGTLDKYIGDEVMAVFGNIGPNNPAEDASRAVKTAVEMQAELERLQVKWLSEGIVPLQIRTGIHTGEALVGYIGSPQQKDFTVIGDTVNTAKRLVALNKDFNTTILISQATYALVRDQVEARFLGPAPIKGRQEPMPVYELTGWRP